MQSILVTGGAGYIGSHACKMLREAGFEPVCYDNFSKGWEAAVKFGPLVRGDVRDREGLVQAMKVHNIEAVMHFAALSEVGVSTQDPGSYYENNVFGSLQLFRAMIDAGINKIVFSSTCAVYGESDGELLTEESRKHPINPYGRTKLMVETILADMDTSHKLKSHVMRYFNVAGADEHAEIGEHHVPETHLIPLVLDAAIGRREAIKIFGTDYATPDGTCIRDYIHVMDLIEAHIASLKLLLGGAESDAFNLGTGVGFSVREIIDEVAVVTGADILRVEETRRPGDPAFLVSGATKALETLRWTPHRSKLNRVIRDAWRWHRKGGYPTVT